jgi:predicted ATPase/DNA-binding CsgD family transcriptional regulator
MPTAIRRAGNVPAELPSFVDRRAEVAELKALLGAARLVTLTGVAGVGKTRLGLHVGAQLVRAFPGGVWVVRLAPVADGALVAHAVAQTLGLRDVARDPMSVVADYLRVRPALLVLDNCSHLVDACAQLTEALLGEVESLRILVTSREVMRVAREHVFTVPPLACPAPDETSQSDLPGRYPAIALFAERAVAAVPSFRVTSDNSAHVAAICRRLDGIPLAIELAAARLRVLSVEQLLHRLDDRFSVLTNGRRSAWAHQQTLRAAVDWSFDLCTADEQVVWARASVFGDGFGLAAAEEICSGKGIAAGAMWHIIDGLVAKSILIRQEHAGAARFRLLGTLRQYGREKLSHTAAETEVRQRHADWYLHLAERGERQWCGHDELDTLQRLQTEHPNLTAALDCSLNAAGQPGAALRMASALWFYWVNAGVIGEGLRWVERALAHHGAPGLERAKALWAAGFLATVEVDVPAATRLLGEAHDAATEAGDDSMLARVVGWQGVVEMHRGDVDQATSLMTQALTGFRELDESDGVHALLIRLALATGHLLRGDLSAAAELANDSVGLCQAREAATYHGYALTVLARIEWMKGDPARATALAQESLRLRRALPHAPTLAAALDLLAWTAEAAGQHERAAVLFGALDWVCLVFGLSVFRSALPGPHLGSAARTREALGDAAFAAAMQRGCKFDVDQIIGYALGEDITEGSSPIAPTENAVASLTSRERQVADLVAQGLSNRQIAERLVIAPRTAESHIEHILHKLAFSSRTQIATWAVRASKDSSPPPDTWEPTDGQTTRASAK